MLPTHGACTACCSLFPWALIILFPSAWRDGPTRPNRTLLAHDFTARRRPACAACRRFACLLERAGQDRRRPADVHGHDRAVEWRGRLAVPALRDAAGIAKLAFHLRLRGCPFRLLLRALADVRDGGLQPRLSPGARTVPAARRHP